MSSHSDPYTLNAAAIEQLLDPQAALFPELEAVRANPALLRERPQAARLLERSAPFLADAAAIPMTRYTAYRRFVRDGDRAEYEGPYFDKRAALAAAAMQLFLGDADAKDTVQDYIWNICEETNWVAPAHERCRIDLFAAETAFLLAETLALLGTTLDVEVRSRVRFEVERRVFGPYLAFHALEWWYQGYNNWNGVCNSAVAAAFLLLEPEPGRVAQAVAIALRGLQTFLEVAFEADGSSNEGVSYWHYGLINFVALSELLYARSRGAINLLDSARVRDIAAYPARMQLSGPKFASFSDCDELLGFHPGILMRLAERTGDRTLQNLVGELDEPGKRPPWRLPMNLRNLLWWDGVLPARVPIGDAVLPVSGVARLEAQTPSGAVVVLALKAGHNAENHNQNDVGSFLVHVAGENLLVDPGRGLYSRFYFGPQRYENIFANSYGHSVPRIAGQLQAPGAEYRGELLGVARNGAWRTATLELARAYPVPQLLGLRRELAISDDGVVTLMDQFSFDGAPADVEEAFVTWGAVELAGATALIRGEQHDLRLTIEAPQGAVFALEYLEEQSRANKKPDVLKRLTATLHRGETFRVRMDVVQRPGM